MSNETQPLFIEAVLPFEKAIEDLSPTEVSTATKNFSKHPMRGILGMKLRVLIREQQQKLESASTEEFKKIQGVIQGLRIAHGLIQREN